CGGTWLPAATAKPNVSSTRKSAQERDHGELERARVDQDRRQQRERHAQHRTGRRAVERAEHRDRGGRGQAAGHDGPDAGDTGRGRRQGRISKRGAAAVSTARGRGAPHTPATVVASASIGAGTSAAAVGCRPSATIRTSRVSGPTVERRLCRNVQRRAWAWRSASAKITSPGSARSTSPEKPTCSSPPSAGRTSRWPATPARSKTATGSAKARESALHTSTSGCTRGRSPSRRKRRRSASAAERYWVGFEPIWV